jgi:hypothetical protein
MGLVKCGCVMLCRRYGVTGGIECCVLLCTHVRVLNARLASWFDGDLTAKAKAGHPSGQMALHERLILKM